MSHPDYPKRLLFSVNGKELNDKAYFEKCPIFTHKSVIANMNSTSGYKWADEEEMFQEDVESRKTYSSDKNDLKTLKEVNIKFNKYNQPLNPYEKTGLAGRGILGKWGPNHAADPIIAYQDSEGNVWCILVRRKDCNQYAIPGGFVDDDCCVSETLKKELTEEAVDATPEFIEQLFIDPIHLHSGYVDDPRNTDNAWIETNVNGVCISKLDKQRLTLKNEDSEHNTDSTKWIKIDTHNPDFENLYANHKQFLLMMRSAIRGMNHHPPHSEFSNAPITFMLISYLSALIALLSVFVVSCLYSEK